MGGVGRSRTDSARADSISDEVSHQDFERLVADHSAFVWRVLRRMGLSAADADDATQQVFMIAARRLNEIASDRARAFLYGTAIRVARNARRGLERRREVLGEPPDAAAPEGRGSESMTEISRVCALLDEVLAKLPEDLRRVLVLARIEQLEVAEIAALECIPVGTAASRLRRARSRLRELLEAVEHRNPFGRQP